MDVVCPVALAAGTMRARSTTNVATIFRTNLNICISFSFVWRRSVEDLKLFCLLVVVAPGTRATKVGSWVLLDRSHIEHCVSLQRAKVRIRGSVEHARQLSTARHGSGMLRHD